MILIRLLKPQTQGAKVMPEINFSIRVIDDEGEGVEGVEVYVNYSMTIDHQYTDDDGWAEFEKDQFMDSVATGEVIINGVNYGKYSFEDGDTRSFTI
jgi:uncharacterized GH25 family protein